MQQRISRVESEISTKLSALGTVRSSLSTLQSTLSGINTAESLQIRRATSSDTTVFRATATAASAPGNYNVEVLELATAHKLASTEQAGGAAATVGSGTLNFSQNGQSFSVVVDAAMTLAELRTAINTATGNTGVQAALISTGSGARLSLTSSATGVAREIGVTVTNPAGGLDTFVSGLATTTPAKDASVKIDGFTVTGSTNTIAGAIEGVSLDLLAAKPGTTLSLGVTNDTQAVKDRINKLVSDFNNFQTQSSRLRAYDPRTRVGGPLLGDSALRNLESSLRRELTGSTASAPATTNSLTAIGIRFGADGKLTVNDTQLSEALANRFGDLTAMLTASDGLVPRLNAVIDAQISSEGALTARTNSLDARKRTVEKDKEAMEARLALIEKRYRAQFINLDRMLADMQGTSSYISRIGSQ
jgi:flagellar hook-associated protein 2